jgi:hypothetical protein
VKFLDREGPAVAAPVRLHVQPVEVAKRRLDGPPVLDHPAAELLDGRQVEVECLSADAAIRVAVLATMGRLRETLASSVENNKKIGFRFVVLRE